MSNRRRTQTKPVPWALFAVLAALLFVAFVRLRVGSAPLERDEGEYAYAGRLILEGIPPYSIAYNMKFPGTYYAYALILAIFGSTPFAIHVGLLLVNAATILLVFSVGRRLFGDFAGAAAAVSFAILSVDRWILGISAHATHFVVLATMAGWLALLRANENKRAWGFFSGGVLLGIAVLMKQHAIFFLPLGAMLVFAGERTGDESEARVKVRRVGVVSLGALLPITVIFLVLFAQGVLGRFWFWTFRYASQYVSEIALRDALPLFLSGFRDVTPSTLAFWVLGGLGLATLWLTSWARTARIFTTGLFIASFVAICPGFYFRQHYFILVLPALALGCGIAVASLRQHLARRLDGGSASLLAAAVLVVAIGIYTTKEADFLFSMSTRDVSRVIYSVNPFIEAVEIGKYIREHSDGNDRIAVIGSEPEIYFYADRKAATGYIYTYALMEPQPYAKTMQQEMIREIESAHPLYLVFTTISMSWLARPDSDQGIVTWVQEYGRRCYDVVGVTDIVSEKETRMLWDGGVRGFTAASPNLVYTLRRKSDVPCAVAR